MRLLLAAAVVASLPLTAYADPEACATTINSKGVETTVCNPYAEPTTQPVCRSYYAGSQQPLVPYVKVCVAPY